MFLLASVFRLLTPQNKHLVSSFNNENYHCIEAHLFYFLCFFWLQYFDSLPIKISTWCRNNENNHCIEAHIV